MASEMAIKWAHEWRKHDAHLPLEDFIDRAIRASHAQRTRQQNKALAKLADKGWKTLSIVGMQNALRLARRGAK